MINEGKNTMKTITFNLFGKEIEIIYLGMTKNGLNDNEIRDTYYVQIDKEDGFKFYDSIANKEKRIENPERVEDKEVIKELVYGILSCMAMDYNVECDDYYEFCNEFGYTPSHDTQRIFDKVKSNKELLHRHFLPENIELLDENDDKLQKFVDKLDWRLE